MNYQDKVVLGDCTLYLGDCLQVMKSIPDEFVDLTVTSPPYDNLRTYDGYIFDFENIANQLLRITKRGGIVVWIVGDETVNGSETGTSFKQALYFREIGFNLHDTMIYEKTGMRYPDSTRYNAIFEYMFIFSKEKVKTFNAITDHKNLWSGEKIARKSQVRKPDGTMSENSAYKNDKNRRIRKVGVRNNIWRYSSGPENARGRCHPAAFPECLARDHIISWSNENNIVFDPMMGSGTTGKIAVKYNRKFVGIEISKKYFEIAVKRIKDAQQQMRLPL
jgi:site-specific DNA-methyltransferase (adenine-specific)